MLLLVSYPWLPPPYGYFVSVSSDVAPHAPREPVTVFYMYGCNIVVPKFVLALYLYD
jgi:hypothetical protein